MNIFLSRYFEAGNAGWIFYVSNNFSFIVIIAGLTIENSVTYYSSKKEMNDSELAWFSIAWSFFVTLIVFAGLAVYFTLFKKDELINHSDYFYYAICYVGGIQMTNFFTALFYANKNFYLPNFIMAVLNIIVIIIIPKQAGTYNTDTSFIIKLYFTFFVITGFALAAAFIMQKQSWKTLSLPVFAHIRLLIRYAVLSLAANVIFFLVYRVDYWFVEKYCNATELGNYIQVSKLGQMLLVIPTIISSVVFPHTASGVSALIEMKDNIMRIGRITTMLFSILFLVMILSGKWVFPFVFGQTFKLMYVPFLLLLPGIWALSNLYILSAYFGGINKVKINVQGASVALLVILTGDILFIPHYGIFAAAIVSTAGYTINFLYSFFILQKEHTVSFGQYWSINKEDIQWLKNIIQK
ncbi:lipopolysaccharide biosynthesis protein [Segetibacter koreensis]|uniref:lipopolysaccharide biosynthesis protein n=1 Tax=Segetibacter koreensis TaxID=398037 RepID=UPI00146A4164|nr:polysaccharide biosynthesis C-terminal domain-containing protein [Segetibacter koreensis]